MKKLLDEKDVIIADMKTKCENYEIQKSR